MIRLAVFDMAGTTVHDLDYVAQALHAALLEEGLDFAMDDINAVMGISKPTAIAMLLEQAEGSVPDSERVEPIFHAFEHNMLSFYENSEDVREMPGASDNFVQLRDSGIKVALDTGFSRRIADVILQRLGWEVGVHIDAVVASDEVDAGRPAPDMVFRLMNILGIESAEEVAKIGDTPVDLGEGFAAGCGLNIGVLSGSTSEDILLQHPHTHIVADVSEATMIIIEQNAGAC